MDKLIFHNDRILPLGEARLSPGQVGLLMGWGVFSTLRIYRGRPFAFERHWARLMRDAGRLGIPISYAMETVERATEELVEANGHPESMARISLVKNHGGLWAEAPGRPDADLLIFTRELVAWPPTQRLMLETSGIFAGGHYAGTKMLSWVSHAAVLDKAHHEGFDDALLTNERGHLAECTSANVFLVRGGKILTPPLASGCLPGITREVLLEIAPPAGIEIRERELRPEDLATAEEVFISSTTREIAPIAEIHPGWKYPAPGPVSVRAEEIFKGYVGQWLGGAARAS
jgi:branched-chain amino acid aminotransferase